MVFSRWPTPFARSTALPYSQPCQAIWERSSCAPIQIWRLSQSSLALGQALGGPVSTKFIWKRAGASTNLILVFQNRRAEELLEQLQQKPPLREGQ